MIDEVALSKTPSRDQLLRAERTLKLSMSPLPKEEIVKRLMVVKVTTGSRNMGDGELELQLEVYADKLSKFPADCVARVLEIASSGDWWPKWGELELMLSPMDQTRKALLREIEKRLSIVQTSHKRGGVSSIGDLMKLEGQ